MPTIVVAGASLAGLRSVESLRAGGWNDEIIVIGQEPYMPYSRPPLSKELWTEHCTATRPELRRRPTADSARWLLGAPVTACDLKERTLVVGDAVELHFDGLVAATGVRPRRLPLIGPTLGRVTLRTYTDFLQLRTTLQLGSRLVIIGSGFIGCEIAASLASSGHTVDVVSLDEVPMQHPLGHAVGRALQTRLEVAGVRFHLGRKVAATTGDERVEEVVLDNGTILRCDVLLESVGSLANTEWLAGNGLDLSDGVLCDGDLRCVGAKAVVAAGDVARYADPLFGPSPRRVEHWGTAGPSAKRAAATLLADLNGDLIAAAPFSSLPTFWSDQGSMRLQGFGDLSIADGVAVAEGSLDADAAVIYTQGTRAVGVVLIGMAAATPRWRTWLMEQLLAHPPEPAEGSQLASSS